MGGSNSKESPQGGAPPSVTPDDCPVLNSRDGSSGASGSGADSRCPIPEQYRGGSAGVYNVYNQRIDGAQAASRAAAWAGCSAGQPAGQPLPYRRAGKGRQQGNAVHKTARPRGRAGGLLAAAIFQMCVCAFGTAQLRGWAWQRPLRRP